MSLIDDYSAYLIDLDGVMYRGETPVPRAGEVIAQMQNRGLDLLFLTNNSAATPEMYVRKLAGMGVAVEARNVMNSAQALYRYIEENFETGGKTCFLIGGAGLEQEIENSGMKLLVGEAAKHVDFVIVGWDRSFDYEKLKTASLAIRNGAVYLAANKDATYPMAVEIWPGAGAIVAAVTTAAGREPVKSIGKPDPYMVRLGLERLGALEKDALMIGDRLETDILAGNAAGVDTLLVLSGISSREDVEKSGITPTYVLDSLASML
jgi:4-nitrophenyl phosphatase